MEWGDDISGGEYMEKGGVVGFPLELYIRSINLSKWGLHACLGLVSSRKQGPLPAKEERGGEISFKQDSFQSFGIGSSRPVAMIIMWACLIKFSRHFLH